MSKDISKKINQQINDIKGFGESYNVGSVISVYDGIVIAIGLEEAFFEEIVIFDNGSKGVIVNMNENSVGIAVFNNFENIKEGDLIRSTGEKFTVKVGKNLLGRVINPIGEPLDGLGEIDCENDYAVERDAPDIISRQSVCEPLATGIKTIDLLIPIGKGQRELIIGDRGTGKSSILLDTIVNQKQYHDSGIEKNKVYCVYVAIGQRMSFIVKFIEALKKQGALEYSVVVVASASDSASFKYFAPYVGCAIGEWFMDNGMHSLVCYDDLSKHAVAYREISLLLKRPPGREAYPGDAFFIHSKLLERSAKLSDEKGGGSLTALPVVETLDGDISSYIPTNVISITDGQVFLDMELFNSGFLPAIDIGLSVSRVGSAAQLHHIKKSIGSLKLEILNFLDIQSFIQFSSDLDDTTKDIVQRGNIILELLKQNILSPVNFEEQLLILIIYRDGYLNSIDKKELKNTINTVLNMSSDILMDIRSSFSSKKFSDELRVRIKNTLNNIFEKINS